MSMSPSSSETNGNHSVGNLPGIETPGPALILERVRSCRLWKANFGVSRRVFRGAGDFVAWTTWFRRDFTRLLDVLAIDVVSVSLRSTGPSQPSRLTSRKRGVQGPPGGCDA